MREALHTFNRSPIKRHHPVGKRISTRIYVHRDYALRAIPRELFQLAMRIAETYPFEFTCVCYDLSDGTIRLDEAPDFDTAREPVVGNYLSISPAKGFRLGKSPGIWHHKWLWVLDDYTGFDVQESYKWSRTWLAKLKKSAKGTQRTWLAQLAEVGLE